MRADVRTLLVVVLVGLPLAVGCSSPTRPSVSVAVGRPVSPGQDAAVSYYSQPITLTVTSGIATAGATPTSVLEVATDPAFQAIVTTRTLPDTAGRSSTVTLDRLEPGTTYYWRVKTTAGDTASVVSRSSSFTVGPQLVIKPPLPVQPLSDSFPQARPTFTVRNAARTGPPATLTYTFEVATDTGFSTLIASGNVPEGTDQTSFTPQTDLAPRTTYFWRVRASDLSLGVVGDASIANFRTAPMFDGVYRYFLTLHLPPFCLGGPTHIPTSVQWDDGLSVSGDRLTFHLRVFSYPSALDLNLTRTGDTVTGTIGGEASVDFIDHIYIFQTPSYTSWPIFWTGAPATTTGTARPAGRFEGTFHGFAAEANYANPTFRCTDMTFQWTLEPHP